MWVVNLLCKHLESWPNVVAVIQNVLFLYCSSILRSSCSRFSILYWRIFVSSWPFFLKILHARCQFLDQILTDVDIFFMYYSPELITICIFVLLQNLEQHKSTAKLISPMKLTFQLFGKSGKTDCQQKRLMPPWVLLYVIRSETSWHHACSGLLLTKENGFTSIPPKSAAIDKKWSSKSNFFQQSRSCMVNFPACHRVKVAQRLKRWTFGCMARNLTTSWYHQELWVTNRLAIVVKIKTIIYLLMFLSIPQKHVKDLISEYWSSNLYQNRATTVHKCF